MVEDVIQNTIGVLSSRAERSRRLGLAAVVLSLLVALIAGVLVSEVTGVVVGMGCAILSGIALAKKMNLDQSVSDVRDTLQLGENQRKRLADALSGLHPEQVTAGAVHRIVENITHPI